MNRHLSGASVTSRQQGEDAGGTAGSVADLHWNAKYRRAFRREFFSVGEILEAWFVRAKPEPMHREIFRVAGIDAGGIDRNRDDVAILQ